MHIAGEVRVKLTQKEHLILIFESMRCVGITAHIKIRYFGHLQEASCTSVRTLKRSKTNNESQVFAPDVDWQTIVELQTGISEKRKGRASILQRF